MNCQWISYDEQLGIAARLRSLESQIQAHQVALGKLRELKSGLLHDLLTGRVRVNIAEAAAR
jgi:type I restriction enzyme S subunit